MCPGWPPGLRPLFLRGEQRRRCLPAKPSEEGGLEELVELRLRAASWRSKSTKRLSLSTMTLSLSPSSSRDSSTCRCNCSFCSCSCSFCWRSRSTSRSALRSRCRSCVRPGPRPSGSEGVTCFVSLPGSAKDQLATVPKLCPAKNQCPEQLPALLPGRYRVTAEATGFKQMKREPVSLAVDQV